jgi:hypothetical protein
MSKKEQFQRAEDQGAFLLRELKGGTKIGPLANKLDTSPVIIEQELEKLRRSGRVRCTNKTWYRADALESHKPKEPRERPLSSKELKFLARQQGFGFGERRG